DTVIYPGSILKGKTVIGNDNLLLTMVHIAHDCQLGNKIVISNAVQVAGHVTIGDNAVLGGMAGITQFCRIGKLAMVGGYSKVNQDVPPFMLIEGNPAAIRTLNVVGLERNGVSKESQKAVKEAYRILFRSKMNLTQALEKIADIDITPEVRYLIDFLKAESKTGIMRRDSTQDDLSPV
ncbi:MAG: hypothetical protein AABZ14_01845, partial [Candidatus Margulisiibacteriota bacterium]